MSTTLDTLWSIHGLAGQADISQSTEALARRDTWGFRFPLFYGAMWLLVFAVLGGRYFRHRKRNPDKAKKLEQGLCDASASVAHRIKTAQNRAVRFAWVSRSTVLVLAFALSTACSGSDGSGYSEGEDISGPGPSLHGPYCGTLETSGTPIFPDAQQFVIGVTEGPLNDGDCGPVLQFFQNTWLLVPRLLTAMDTLSTA